MARKRYSDEDVLKLLREIDVHLHDGLDVVSACRKAGISDKSYYYCRKKFGGLCRTQVSEMKLLKKENERFNGTLRKEVLNAEWFHTTRQAQVAINVWLRQYNQIRQHHALNMRPPVPETLLENTKMNGRI